MWHRNQKRLCMKVARGALVAAAVVDCVACDSNAMPGELAAVDILPTLNYEEDARPIIREHCVPCHVHGGIAPFALESFDEVRGWLPAVREAVVSRRMPPWLADRQVGIWSNDRSLSDDARNVIVSWIDGGASRGAVVDKEEDEKDGLRWVIGEPDAVLRLPNPVEVPASGIVPYRYVYVPTGFAEDRWVVGVQIRPSSPEVVHHALVFVEEAEYEGEVLYETVDRPGFQTGEDGWFAAYVPGPQAGSIFPPDTGKLLPKGATLKVQLHLTPHGHAVSEETEIGLLFATDPPRWSLETDAAMAMDFLIPPYAEDYRVTAVHRFEEDVALVSLWPHMHLRGKSFEFTLHLPDGQVVPLLHVPHWNMAWQDEYWFANPLPVPRGSWLRATGWFDNSQKNPNNPDPSTAVRFGEQTFDEMMNGYFQYIVRSTNAVAY